MSLGEKHALVTGASRGLGLRMCEALLDENYIVFGASRTGAQIEHGRYVDLIVDVCEESSVEQMYEQIGEVTYGIDLIVNNAGIYDVDRLAETSSKDFLKMINTNLLGPFHILKHGIEYVVEGSTHVVTIGGIAGSMAFKETGAYCATKFGLKALLEVCEMEWRELNVRFSNLNPGAIKTSLWDQFPDFSKDRMMTIEQFLYVFQMVIKAPPEVQFSNLTFTHLSGVIK